jgi:4-aminobutyrate aminotransferase-like enzyme
MANGQPIGLTMAKAAVADEGTFANISTYGASPISMVAASATLRVIEEEKLLFNAQMMGKALRDGLESLKERFPGIGEVRGMGLMQALELVVDETAGDRTYHPQLTLQLFEATKKRGLLIGKGGRFGNVVRLTPPMTINDSQIDDALKILADSLAEIGAA